MRRAYVALACSALPQPGVREAALGAQTALGVLEQLPVRMGSGKGAGSGGAVASISTLSVFAASIFAS